MTSLNLLIILTHRHETRDPSVLTYEPNLVQNVAELTASRNSSKWGTYRSSTKNGELYGFVDLWQQIWLTSVRLEHWKLIISREVGHNWIKNSQSLNLINQSVERHREELWLPESGTFTTPPWIFPTMILKLSQSANKLKRTTRHVTKLVTVQPKIEKPLTWNQKFFSDIRSWQFSDVNFTIFLFFKMIFVTW